MVPSQNPNRFIGKYGRLWYLREFDYLPQAMELYQHDVSAEFMRDNVNFKFFTSRESAEWASNEIRKILGLPKYDFEKQRLVCEGARKKSKNFALK